MSEATKEEKVLALVEAVAHGYIARDIALKIGRDIEDAERLRLASQVSAPTYEMGQASCAAGPWCYDLEKAEEGRNYILLMPEEGWDVGYWYSQNPSGVSREWRSLLADFYLVVKPIAFAEVHLPEEKP